METASKFFELGLQAPFPGALAGFVLFLVAIKSNRIKNNHHLRKAVVEIFGASIVSSCIVLSLPLPKPSFWAFIIGLGWTTMIEQSRSKITKIAEALLGNTEELSS